MQVAEHQLLDLRPKFKETRKKLLSARHLPGEVYSSPEIYAMEKEQIFMKYWLSVGRVEEIPDVGDYYTFQVMKESIVVSRPAPDQVVAYMNQCLHRGVEIAVGRGNAKEFSCPYHAWLYDVSGKLVVAPGMKASEVELKNCSLRQLHVKVWRGWIFVNFSDEPMSFDDYIAPFEQPLWWFQTDHCKLAQKVEIDVKCNWKFLVENLIDIYHVGVIHKGTFGGFVKGEQVRFNLVENGGWHTQYEARPHSKSGEQVFPTLPWAQDKPSGIACKAGIYPNLNLSMRADSVRMWHIWPISPTETKVICYLLFPEGAFSIPNYDEEMEKYVGFVRQIIAEDAVMVEGMQNTAGSKFFQPGPMSPLEEALYHMENHYIDVMTSEAA